MHTLKLEYKHTPSDTLFDHDVRIKRAISNMIVDRSLEYEIRFMNGTRSRVERQSSDMNLFTISADGTNGHAVFAFGELRDYLVYLADRPINYYTVREIAAGWRKHYSDLFSIHEDENDGIVDFGGAIYEGLWPTGETYRKLYYRYEPVFSKLGTFQLWQDTSNNASEIPVRIFDRDFCTVQAVLMARMTFVDNRK